MSSSSLNELLRMDPPVQMINREAFVDVNINGTHINRGEKVLMILASANHDPKAFLEPHTFNFKRPRKRLLTFGAGKHTCIGIHLAQLQVKVTFEAIAKHLPHMTALDIKKPHWKKHLAFRGLEQLPVKLVNQQ